MQAQKGKGRRNSPPILFATSLKFLVKYCCTYNIRLNYLLICYFLLVRPLFLSNIHAHVKMKLPSFMSSPDSSIFTPFNDFRFTICGSPLMSSSLSSVLGLTNALVVFTLSDLELFSKTVCKLQHTHVAW